MASTAKKALFFKKKEASEKRNPFKIFRRNRRFARFVSLFRRRQRKDLYRHISAKIVVRHFFKGYYGFLRTKQFIKHVKKVRRNKFLSLGDSIVSHLERRLLMFFYRARYLKNLYECKKFIRLGNLKVNGRVVTYPYYTLKPGDMVQITPVLNDTLVSAKMGRRRKGRRNVWKVSPHIYIRKRIGILILKTNPLVRGADAPVRRGPRKEAYGQKYFMGGLGLPNQKTDVYFHSRQLEPTTLRKLNHEAVQLSDFNTNKIRRMAGVYQLKHLTQYSNKLT